MEHDNASHHAHQTHYFDDTHWLAIVTKVMGKSIDVHYYGTHGRTLRTAVWKPLYVIMSQDKLSFTRGTRWAGSLHVSALPGCVVARRLRLSKAGVLCSESYRAIQTLVATLTHALADKA